MADGWVATRLGLPGIPAAAEEAMIARDISLAELTGGRLHVAHLSTAGAVSLVRQAKDRGIPVTAEVCPHHLTITDQWALGTKGVDSDAASPLSYDTFTKVYPPLRSQSDVDALVAALADGVIDCVATDHAPHTVEEKAVRIEDAPFGVIGLETAFALLFSELVATEKITLEVLVDRLTEGPARAYGLEANRLAPGSRADLAVFDLESEWVVAPERFRSKARNTPFAGWSVRGRPVLTLVNGRIVHDVLTDR